VRSAIRALVFPVFVFLATMLLMELAMRVQEPFLHLMTQKYHWANRFVGDPVWHHWPRPAFRSTHAMIDPVAYPQPFVYQTNSLGLRDDRELAIPKPAGLARILILGDSMTEGYYAEDTVSVRLEARLKELFPGTPYEVINAGCSSYSPLLAYLRLKHQLAHLNPDLVILNVDPSDIFDDAERYRAETVFDSTGAPVASGGPLGPARQFADWIKNWSYLARCASWFWQTRNAARGSAEATYVPYHSTIAHDAEAWQKEVAPSIGYIRRIIAFCRERNIRIAVTTHPHKRHIAPDPGQPAWHRGYERAIEAVCREERVPFYSAYDDIARAYPTSAPLYWHGDVHFTPVGQRLWSALLINFYLARLHGEAVAR
jgi:lysophospholipase L1-like esterase